MNDKGYKVGYLLRSSITGFIAGAKVTEQEAPAFGALVKAPFGESTWIYGLIYEMHIDDDGAVMQIATTDAIAEAVIADNRKNRTVPLEISVLTVGHRKAGKLSHLLPPRAPLSLDVVWQCDDEELCQFTERFGYLRHILRNEDLPVAELIAAHMQQASAAHRDSGNKWRKNAVQEIIALLRDDYEQLMRVLSALTDAFSN